MKRWIYLILLAPWTLRADPPTSAPAEAIDIPILNTQGPLAYYADNCARCHGPAENAYVARTKPKRGTDLRRTIQEMAEGPAMAPISDAELDEQLKLHEAIFDRKPYVWVAPDNAKVIAGEVIPRSEVQLVTNDKRIRAKTSGYRFVLPREPGDIIVQREGHTATTRPAIP